MYVNRDDQSGFRLDTLSTHHQYPTPAVRGKETLTTFTDFVNKYPSTLQINFTATGTTDEVCVGVVKPQPLHSKCPAQHMEDLKMIQDKEELKEVFYTSNGTAKLIDCVRVDGATDEGPHRSPVLVVRDGRDGSSYLNRVELQNGCLTRAHSNIFIPSTLHGSPISTTTGKLDNDLLCKNLSSAIDVYCQRCDGAPCGKTSIKLYPGAKCNAEKRESLLIFLKGSKKKFELMRKDPELFDHFNTVWTVRNNHLVPN